MSSVKFGSVLGKFLLGFAGISVAVCAYKFYSSNKNKDVPSSNSEQAPSSNDEQAPSFNGEQAPNSNSKEVPSSNGEDATPNEPAKVKLDGLFMFYDDNELTFIPEIKEDMEFPANKVLMSGEDGSGLDADARNWYEHYFNLMTCGPLSRYGGL